MHRERRKRYTPFSSLGANIHFVSGSMSSTNDDKAHLICQVLVQNKTDRPNRLPNLECRLRTSPEIVQLSSVAALIVLFSVQFHDCRVQIWRLSYTVYRSAGSVGHELTSSIRNKEKH